MTAVAPPPGAVASSLAQTTPELPVATPNAQVIFVLGQQEQDFYNGQSARYQHDFAFTNVSDLADLDQLLFLETMAFRYQRWLTTGRDYDNMTIDEATTHRRLKDTQTLMAQVKSGLGMTKAQRDKDSAESPAAYLTTLKQRAKEFGVHRENQLTTALALINDLFAKVGAFDRADEVERRKLEFPDEHAILEWIRNEMRPRYDAVDAHFRANAQRYWLKDL